MYSQVFFSLVLLLLTSLSCFMPPSYMCVYACACMRMGNPVSFIRVAYTAWVMGYLQEQEHLISGYTSEDKCLSFT